MEHVYDRLVRVCKEQGVPLNILFYSNESACFYYNNYKSKTNSWHNCCKVPMPVTWLKTCELCGKISTPKKVSARNDCWDWNLKTLTECKKNHGSKHGKLEWITQSLKGRNILCTGCWNKAKAIVKKENEAVEINRLTNKLTKERLRFQKLQTPVN